MITRPHEGLRVHRLIRVSRQSGDVGSDDSSDHASGQGITVSRSSNLRKVLEVAALRAARGVDAIDAPEGAGARYAYQWLSVGGIHGDRFSAYYHGYPYSRAEAMTRLSELREAAASDGACEKLLAALDEQRTQLWRLFHRPTPESAPPAG